VEDVIIVHSYVSHCALQETTSTAFSWS